MHFFNNLLDKEQIPESATLESPHICRACAGTDLRAYVAASSKGLETPIEECEYIYYKCEHCGSLNEYSESNGYYEEAPNKDFTNFYIDVGAGIAEMIAPVGAYAQANREKKLNYLELGCGFGFVVNYAKTCLGYQAYGIEPSGYGREGEKLLKINISKNLLGNGSPHDNAIFDIIYAHEVIEHVTNPTDFGLTVCEHLSQVGIAMLTSPNADFITQSAPTADSYSCLFPGEHKIIFSERGLDILLKNVGLTYTYIRHPRPSNLIAYTSTQPDPVKSIASALIKSNEDYTREYLQKFRRKKSILEVPYSRLELAMLYRLFKDFVNTGDSNSALELLSEIIEDLRLEADPSMPANTSKPDDRKEIVLVQALSISSLCLIKERILTEDLQYECPGSGIVFAKNMGFFIISLIHQIETLDLSAIIDSSISYLQLFISYAISLRTSKARLYHLEFISLIGPAVSSLMMLQLKGNRLIDASYFPFINEQWFQIEHPNSHKEIISHLKIFRERIHLNHGHDANLNPILLQQSMLEELKDRAKQTKKAFKRLIGS